MRIQQLHSAFIMPTKGSNDAGAFDIYMPEPGIVTGGSKKFGLGFATEIPKGFMAIMAPRSSAAKSGLELNNTVGYIDADYRGEWMAVLRTKSGLPFEWNAGDRLLQFTLVPIWLGELELVESVGKTERGAGGFGSSGR